MFRNPFVSPSDTQPGTTDDTPSDTQPGTTDDTPSDTQPGTTDDTPSDTQPGTTDDTPSDTQHPDAYSAMVAAGRKRLTHDQVAQIREAYMWARSAAWSAETAEEWENVITTEKRLSREFGVSRTSIHNVVLGLTYPDAPGPVDHARRTAHDRYRADVEKFGDNVARSRARDINPADPQLRLDIHQPGGEVISQVLSPGSVVRVEYVADTPAQD